MTEAGFVSFIQANIGSVYALDLLLLLKRNRHRAWHPDGLVRELRSSPTAVAEALNRLVRAGLVSENPPGCFVFAPISPDHEQSVSEIERAYTSAPLSVVKAIMVP